MGRLGLFSFVGLFAEAGEGAGNGAQPPGGGIAQLMLPFVAIFFLFYFLIMRPQKRKDAEHKALLAAIKKNDRVVTIGGIYGVVMNVVREADRVTLKIDEATNAKIDVTFGAIARVIVDEQKQTESK
jgi:preprotein translocase subunit YajC